MLLLLWQLMSWWQFESPLSLGYQQSHYQVFVYGTLKQPLIRRLIVGAQIEAVPAQLEGFQKSGLTIVPQVDGVVAGYLITLTATQMQRVDRYERLGVRYCRFEVVLASGKIAWVYQRLESDNCEQELR